MTRSYPRLRRFSSQQGQERLVQREVIRLILSLPFDHHDLSASVREALDLYLRSVGSGPEILSDWYDLETEPFPLDDESWEIIRAVLSPPRGERFLDDVQDPNERHRYVRNQFERAVELWGGASGVSGYGFVYRSRLPWRREFPSQATVSLVSFSWPTEFMEEQGPEAMRGFLLQLASRLPFSSGHAGLALSAPFPSHPVASEPLPESFRYPGLDVTPGTAAPGPRVEGVHWLNLLGPPVLAELGGADSLRARLRSPGTTVQKLGSERAVVTLGPGPDAGDLEHGRELSTYRELARVLEPWLLKSPTPPGLDPASQEAIQRWRRRFLD